MATTTEAEIKAEKTVEEVEVEVEVKEDVVTNQEKERENEEEVVKEEKEEEVKMEVEPNTGVNFPVKTSDGKQLDAMGVRKKRVIALNVSIYGFGNLFFYSISQSHNPNFLQLTDLVTFFFYM